MGLGQVKVTTVFLKTDVCFGSYHICRYTNVDSLNIRRITTNISSQSVKGDKLRTIVEINVASTRGPDQLLGFSSKPIGLLTEFTRVGLITGDEKQGPRRDSVDIVEGVKVKELDLARTRRVGRGVS